MRPQVKIWCTFAAVRYFVPAPAPVPTLAKTEGIGNGTLGAALGAGADGGTPGGILARATSRCGSRDVSGGDLEEDVDGLGWAGLGWAEPFPAGGMEPTHAEYQLHGTCEVWLGGVGSVRSGAHPFGGHPCNPPKKNFTNFNHACTHWVFQRKNPS